MRLLTNAVMFANRLIEIANPGEHSYSGVKGLETQHKTPPSESTNEKWERRKGEKGGTGRKGKREQKRE